MKTLGVPAQARMISLSNSRAGDVVVNMARGVAGMRLATLQTSQGSLRSPPNGLELSRSAA
ncbi:MAG: hypothetical protein MUO23_02920, partial [Anaerolineales bacterium]|nr:hypothetical protein [Anaerolineales bacterium]